MSRMRRLDEMLANLRRYVSSLRRLAATPRDKFVGEEDAVGSASYHFLIAIECCIDIANVIIADRQLRSPTDYADTFTILRDANILDNATAENLIKGARFRNLLAHRYWSIDEGRVYQFLQEDLGHFDRFIEAVARSETTGSA